MLQAKITADWPTVLVLFGALVDVEPDDPEWAERAIEAGSSYYFVPVQEPYLGQHYSRVRDALLSYQESQPVPEWLAAAFLCLHKSLGGTVATP